MADELFTRGLAVRKQVMGSEEVDRRLAHADRYTRMVEEMETEVVWGMVFSRPGIPTKVRLMINLALMTALNREDELREQMRAALANGVTKDEVVEVLLQANAYCGGPAGVEAFRVIREVFAETAPQR